MESDFGMVISRVKGTRRGGLRGGYAFGPGILMKRHVLGCKNNVGNAYGQ